MAYRRAAYRIDDDAVTTFDLRVTDPRTGGWVVIQFEMTPDFVLDMARAVQEAMQRTPLIESVDLAERPFPATGRLRRVVDPDGVERAVVITPIARREP